MAVIFFIAAFSILLILAVPAGVASGGLNFIGNTFGYSVALAGDGSYLITGNTDPSDTDHCLVYLAKIGPGGDLIWKRTYDFGRYGTGKSVLAAPDGGYVIAGTISIGNGCERILLLKTDAEGNEIWNRTYGRTGGDAATYASQVFDGGYVIVGKTNAFGNSTSEDIYLVRTDADGNLIWDHTYGDGSWAFGNSVFPTRDGGFVIGGLLRSACVNGADMCLIKTDAGGNISWSKAYGDSKDDFAHFAIPTDDGGYAIIGYSDYTGSKYKGMYLVMTDADGNMVRDRLYYGGGELMTRTNDRGYLLVGSMGVTGNDSQIYLVKTDADGNQAWDGFYGGKNSESPNGVIQASDGGYVVIGDSLNRMTGKITAYLLKTDANGNTLWEKAFSERDFGVAGTTPVASGTTNSLRPVQNIQAIATISHIIVLFFLAAIIAGGYLWKNRWLK